MEHKMRFNLEINGQMFKMKFLIDEYLFDGYQLTSSNPFNFLTAKRKTPSDEIGPTETGEIVEICSLGRRKRKTNQP